MVNEEKKVDSKNDRPCITALEGSVLRPKLDKMNNQINNQFVKTFDLRFVDKIERIRHSEDFIENNKVRVLQQKFIHSGTSEVVWVDIPCINIRGEEICTEFEREFS